MASGGEFDKKHVTQKKAGLGGKRYTGTKKKIEKHAKEMGGAKKVNWTGERQQKKKAPRASAP